MRIQLILGLLQKILPSFGPMTTVKEKVLYWNTTALNDKLGRGMFVQSLGTIFPTFATVQLGAEIMYIDDFPSPIPSGELKT